MITEEIKKFYSELHFPGRYEREDLDFYHAQGIHNVYLREIDRVIDHGMTVLDIGCGTGLVTNLFASKYRSIFTAIDFADSIDHAIDYANNNNLTNTNWIKADFLLHDFGAARFDLVICCGVLHHIPQHQTALVKIKSLMAPSGKLALAVYNPWGKFLKRVVRLDYQSDILYRDQEHNPFEISFSDRQVRRMCQDLDFQSVVPSCKNRLVNTQAMFNSVNGGLALYIYTNK